ncbi:MAG: exosortase N [Raineya sp.]|jgi:exosortase N|nr:exosortase N [Raineya sp.]
MNISGLQTFNKDRIQWILLLFWGLVGIYAYANQILLLSNLSIVVLCIAPLGITTREQVSYRYIPIILIFIILGITLQVRTFFYFAWVYGGILWIEVFLGKTSKLWALLPVIASPLFDYLFSVWSFPLKIGISEATALTFNNLGLKAFAEGNVVVVKGKHFTVDEACMGLRLFSLAYLFSWILLAFVEKKLQKQLSWKFLSVIFLGVFFLNIFANFVRILLLVFLKIPPENPLHEAIGIASVLLYIILPTGMVIKWIFRNETIVNKELINRNSQSSRKQQIIFGGSLSCLFFMILFLQKQPETLVKQQKIVLEIPQLQKKQLPNDIIQFSDDKILVYQKLLKNFYSIEHSPLICWKGSGYIFQQVKKAKVKNTDVWLGILKKENAQLYTAWWMDNGENQSIHLWDWRWQWLKTGKPYYLLNMTASTEKELIDFVEKWLEK